MKKNSKYPILKKIFFLLVLVLPFLPAITTIISGNINFWYDPARDFLHALDNLHKLTLIGPTSGIPGVFYGPYWIWLISFGTLFSHDPRIVVFVILTIPYFTIFPFVLFKFRKIFGLTTSMILWIIFMFSTGIKYATSPWNPHPAPLLLLILIYFVTFTDLSEKGNKKNLKYVLIGAISGLIINFHISLGLGVAMGLFIFLIITTVKYIAKNHTKYKSVIINFCFKFVSVAIGILLTFLPFLIFETRHGFNQIQTTINVLKSSGSVVSVVGLTKMQILQSFFGTIGNLVKIPSEYGYVLLIVGLGYFCYQYIKNKIELSEEEIRLSTLLFSLALSILFLYLTSKNPVWDYHFIGVEIIFLLIIGLVVSKIKFLRTTFLLWVVILMFPNAIDIASSFNQNPYINSSSFATEQRIVSTVTKDAGSDSYNVYAYSPSIYTYEYAYLFKWIGHKEIPYDPNTVVRDKNVVYLIIPHVPNSTKNNFINSKTPGVRFKTVKEWKFEDGTLILKRTK